MMLYAIAAGQITYRKTGQTFANKLCLMVGKPCSNSFKASSFFQTKAINKQISNPPIGKPKSLKI